MAQASSASASEQRGHDPNTRADWDYKTLFHALPGAYLVGRPLFETFRDNPADRSSDGVSRTALTYEAVLKAVPPPGRMV